MLFRSWTVAVLLLLLACAPAAAAPTTVQVRVEGATTTLFEGPVVTDGKVIYKDGHSLQCDGTLNPANVVPGPTMTSALDDASIAGGFTWDAVFYDDFFVSRIGPDANTPDKSWGIALNFKSSDVGGCQQQVQTGDEVLFAYDFFGGPPSYSAKPILQLAGPSSAVPGQPFVVTVTEGADGPAASGATVKSGDGAVVTTTGADGRATVSFASAGSQFLKADRSDSIRSNGLTVCASAGGGGDCTAPPTGQPPAGGAQRPPQVRDTRAPVVRVIRPRNGAALRRGPRLLEGTVTDDASGVRAVRLSLRRHVKGKGCRWWSGSRERFVGHDCRTRFFTVGTGPRWSYLLPKALRRGHYVLDVIAVDRAQNRTARFERGTNRVVFDVVRSRRRAARVQVMVVGKSRILAGPRLLRSRSARVRGSGRVCRVGASTPLAALVALARKLTVSYHVRDYGRCSRRRADGSGQLFVDRIGRDRNRGQNGWFYKVDDVAGTAGGADPRGSFGGPRRGALAPGSRVLWFYCVFDVTARSCQRTLRVTPSSERGAVGGTLRVRVTGYDNEGRGAPVAGAEVRLRSSSVRSDRKGIAQVPLQAAGKGRLTATKVGMVPAFPVPVTIQAATMVR
jgi:hypothetical protein